MGLVEFYPEFGSFDNRYMHSEEGGSRRFVSTEKLEALINPAHQPLPDQPVVINAQGCGRYRENSAIQYLIRKAGENLQEMERSGDFPEDDIRQLAQLLGMPARAPEPQSEKLLQEVAYREELWRKLQNLRGKSTYTFTPKSTPNIGSVPH